MVGTVGFVQVGILVEDTTSGGTVFAEMSGGTVFAEMSEDVTFASSAGMVLANAGLTALVMAVVA